MEIEREKLCRSVVVYKTSVLYFKMYLYFLYSFTQFYKLY